jgi:hypothetical protein
MRTLFSRRPAYFISDSPYRYTRVCESGLSAAARRHTVDRRNDRLRAVVPADILSENTSEDALCFFKCLGCQASNLDNSDTRPRPTTHRSVSPAKPVVAYPWASLSLSVHLH